MNIINQTQLLPVAYKGRIIAKVVYDYQNDTLLVNPWKTYGQVIRDPLTPHDAPSIFRVHGLNEAHIRHCQTQLQDQTFKAVNRQTFWSFLKDKFKFKQAPPQTSAFFRLPSLGVGETVSWSSGREWKLPFVSLPWSVSEKIEFYEYPVQPFIQTLDFYPKEDRLTAIIMYPIREGADVYIRTVESDAQAPFVFSRDGQPQLA